ncbi:MAG TPA: vanadium-dependent haloperoxidase [Chitinophagaceae bacterium]
MFTQLSNRLMMILFVITFAACQKKDTASPEEFPASSARNNEANGHLKQTNTFSADVVKRWLEVQTSMLHRQSGNPFGLNPARYMAYTGVALYEAVVPGMPAYRSLQGQLTDMPTMPATTPGQGYHWPSSAHAALAMMTKKFFSTTPAYNSQAVTDLENELNAAYRAEAGDVMFERSVTFGAEIANRIFQWSTTDNANWPTTPYQLPTAFPGMWQPETPGGAIGFPYWGYNRLMVPGSIDNTESPAPPPYSTNPASAYFMQYNEVYQVSRNLTPQQKLIARYYNDVNPGMPAGAHYLSILRQVIEQFDPALDKASLTYAKTGISLFDGTTASFKAKFTYLNERPFSYIRSVIAPAAVPAWQPFIPTPPYPDFPSNHALFSASVAFALSSLYGSQTPFVNRTYEGVMVDLGSGPVNLGTRHYSSFDAMSQEIGMSRLYGGIHIRYALEAGWEQGRKIAQNIDKTVKFIK